MIHQNIDLEIENRREKKDDFTADSFALATNFSAKAKASKESASNFGQSGFRGNRAFWLWEDYYLRQSILDGKYLTPDPIFS